MLVKTYVQRLRFIWVFNTTFNNISYLMVVGFIDGRIKSTLREQVTDKFEHIILYQVHNFIGWYLIAMNLQWKFELILTCNKAAIDN